MMRTSTCGELTLKALDKEVTLAGWVDTYRDHGDLIFIDLRDRWGVTQVVFNSSNTPQIHQKAKSLRPEFVIQIKGKVSGVAGSLRVVPTGIKLKEPKSLKKLLDRLLR